MKTTTIYKIALIATITLALLKWVGVIDFGWAFITCPLWGTFLIEFMLKLILAILDE